MTSHQRLLQHDPRLAPDKPETNTVALYLWIQRIVYSLFPTMMLHGTPWLASWETKEREEAILVWRYFFLAASGIYVGHYYLLDRPMGLEPDDMWFQFRMSIAALNFAVFLYYLSPTLTSTKYFRLPALLACWIMCYTQAKTMVWFNESQYLYACMFVVITAVLLRMSVLKSLLLSAAVIATQWPSFIQTSLPKPLVVSALTATLLFVGIVRSKYSADVKYFLASQTNLASQRRMIEMNIEFTDRIRSFLPSEISRRLTRYLTDSRMTVLQAVDEVLRPRRKPVACLFTDIRGFTQGSKKADNFIDDGVIPNVKQCTSAIERFGGIPRKVGDLVFAYFDDEDATTNTYRCLMAAFEVIRLNEQFNRNSDSEIHIRRYVLISSGQAVVGNLGGYDSSIEITALGSPVNLLSRIDELTKNVSFAREVTETDIIMSEQTAETLTSAGIEFELKRVDLEALGLTIRDFEEQKAVWALPTHERNIDLLSTSTLLTRESLAKSA